MKEHAKRAHALFNASSADFWMECNLWVHHKMAAEEAGIDYDRSGEAAIRGTMCHESAEEVLNAMLQDRSLSIQDAVMSSQRHDLTEVELDLVETAVWAVFELLAPFGGADSFTIQTEVAIPLSHEPESDGHVDVLAYRPGLVVVNDHKFGEMAVSPNAHQLKIYGANAVRMLLDRKLCALTNDDTVVLAVTQPRLHAEALVRRYTVGELLAYQHHVEHVVANQSARSDRRGAASLSTCEWCPFRNDCDHRTLLARTMFSKMKKGPVAHTTEFIEEVVRSRSAIEKIIKEMTLLVVEDKDRFPNWSRVQVSNGRAWSPIHSEAKIAAQLKKMGVKDVFTLRSPAQVRDANKSIKDVKSKIEKLTVSKGHHVRLYEGEVSATPKSEPPKRPTSKSGNTRKKTSK